MVLVDLHVAWYDTPLVTLAALTLNAPMNKTVVVERGTGSVPGIHRSANTGHVCEKGQQIITGLEDGVSVTNHEEVRVQMIGVPVPFRRPYQRDGV